MSGILARLGTLGLASLFLLGGLNKILTWRATLENMEAVGLAPAALLLPMTIGLELLGGAALIYGRLPSAVAGVLLAIFTLATNVFFHRFWELTGPTADLELSLFFKNVAIAGALLFLAARNWETQHRLP